MFRFIANIRTILNLLFVVNGKMDKVLSALASLSRKGDIMAQELDDLKTQVQKNTDVEASAIILLQGLKDKLDAAIAAGDPAALKALSDQLGVSAEALAAAIVANTPASP